MPSRVTGSSYTRGWETVSHHLLMLRASLVTHLLVSFFGGAILGGLWFYFDLDQEPRAEIGQYIKAAVLSSISGDRKAEFDLGEAQVTVSAEVAYGYLRLKVFGGRSAGFLARQVAFRVVSVGLGIFLLFAFFISRHGRDLAADKRIRGARIQEASELKRGEFLARIRAPILLGMAIGSLSFFLWLGDGSRDLGAYFWSSVFDSFPAAAALASPDETSRTAWYYGPGPQGFRDSTDVRRRLRENAFGDRSLIEILLVWAVLIVAWTSASVVALPRLRWRNKPRGKDIELAGVEVPSGSECYHFLISGSPGSGKSTTIKELLDQVRKRGDRAIVYDTSGEYIEPYYRNGRDIILNPLDARSPSWNLWSEVRKRTDFRTIARALFPPVGKEPFWNEAGATLFACTAEKLWHEGPTLNSKLYSLLATSTLEELAGFLAGTPAGRFLEEQAGTLPANLTATVASRIGAWELLSDPTSGQGAFSIRKWVESESDTWLFLAMRQDQVAALRPLVSLWCDLVSTSILSLQPSRVRRIWVVLDEVASLQQLPSLPPLLERGRKHGAAVVLGLQSMPQLRDAYGRDAAAALASQPQTWLVLRSVEPETAKWLEGALGEQEIDEARESVSMGAVSVRDGVSIQKHTTKRPVVMATEIMGLPDLAGYLKLPGDRPVLKVRFEVKPRKKLTDGFKEVRG